MTCTQCLDNWRSRLPRISSNCPPLSTSTVNLQHSEDFPPMYPISFNRAKHPWAKRRWAGVYCTSDKSSTCVCMINMPRYFPVCTYKVSPRSLLWQVYRTLRKGVVCVSTPCSGVLTASSPSSAPTYTNHLVLITSVSTKPIFRHPEFGGITFLRYIVENLTVP